ncbi:rRNA pseudouridine synthase [Thermomicrobium sp. CFH 73360]|uniref:pseudouridine synthase n=1 Tax=Thermomicrobium sp. CFH 73360 TaxID=2951987 RepID=UPI002076EEF3|nr:pseudouridine synthase [Thermomicrobium sp. CFH 73360]MCM8747469.1 rRNA pseudouridine synthase [Thermomicrobium sp. CFH 73360]
MGEQRLQRVLAAHGVASRRKAEELIRAGRVTVDGVVVRELGTKVDPQRQEIRVDGKLLRPEPRRYIILHKPVGYITTTADELGRKTVLDLVQVPERVVPVGRLDRDSSGLLLLTNDGDLMYRITHPRYELEKEYEVLVDGFPPGDVEEALRRGVPVDGRPVAIRRLEAIRSEPEGMVYRVVIHEGRNRIIRRVFERVGYPVLRLHRVRVGPLRLGDLPSGQWRDLTPGELAMLRRAVGLPETPSEQVRRDRERRGRERMPVRGGDRRPGRIRKEHRRR